MNSNASLSDTFDLRPQSEDKGRSYRSIRIAMVVVGALFALLLGFILSVVLSPGNLSTTLEWVQFLVLVPGISCMFGLMMFAAYKLGAGATSLIVNSGGILFTWPSGRSELLTWDRMTRGFFLLDYTVTPATQRLTGVSWELRRRDRPSSYLSEEAFKAIIKGAEHEGLTVSSIVPASTDFRHNFWGWARCRIITFGTRN